MAAAQVAKKLKDKRKQRTIEGIFKKVDRDGNGAISLSEYFAIFEDHGITVSKTEVERAYLLAGEDGCLTKKNFIKILRSSDLFMKSFDKNRDGVVTETDMMTRAELAFSALDRDNKGFITQKDFRKLTKKLSDQELNDLMSKLDANKDGQLSFEEFKVLFDNAERRRKQSQSSDSEERNGTLGTLHKTGSSRSLGVGNSTVNQQSNTGAKSKQAAKCDERPQEENQRGLRVGSFRNRQVKSDNVAIDEAGRGTRCKQIRSDPNSQEKVECSMSQCFNALSIRESRSKSSPVRSCSVKQAK